MIHCKNCGFDNPDNTSLCLRCNSAQETEETRNDCRELKANPKMSEESSCLVCNGGLEIGEDIIQCLKCSSYYHRNCYHNNHGCTLPNCLEENKNCPFCGSQIKITALKCRFCGKFLDTQMRQQNEMVYQGNHPEAQTALIMGIISIFCCGIILGPTAIVKGSNAIRDIDMNPGLGGRGMALAGKICGIIGTSLGVIYIFFNVIGFM